MPIGGVQLEMSLRQVGRACVPHMSTQRNKGISVQSGGHRPVCTRRSGYFHTFCSYIAAFWVLQIKILVFFSRLNHHV